METHSKDRRDFLKLGAGLTLGSAVLSCRNPSGVQSDQMCLDILHARRSVRKYKSDPVPAEHLTKILDAARMAPTAGNQQPWKFLVIRKAEQIGALKQACIENSLDRFKKNQNRTEEQITERKTEVTHYYSNCFSAPVYVVVLTDNESKYSGYNQHDGPLAAVTLMIAARALGYGTVYYTDSIPDAVTRKVLNIPDRYRRVCITPVGIPSEWPDTPEKNPLDEFVAYNALT